MWQHKWRIFAVLFLEELHDLGYLVFLHLYPGDGGLVHTNDLVVWKSQRQSFPLVSITFQFGIEGIASRSDRSSNTFYGKGDEEGRGIKQNTDWICVDWP